MLDSILNAVKSQVGDLLSKQGVGTDKLDDVVKLSGEAVQENLMSEATSGNLDGVLDLFKGNSSADSSNPIVRGIVSSLTSKLTSALGMGDGASGGIASAIIPIVIQTIVSEFSGSDNEADLGGITSFLSGGDADGVIDKATGMLGGLFK
ncbi:MAG: hypothetical protein ACJAU0_000715 [Flavobacteriales bacterium]|jgi:hypothetical protein